RRVPRAGSAHDGVRPEPPDSACAHHRCRHGEERDRGAARGDGRSYPIEGLAGGVSRGARILLPLPFVLYAWAMLSLGDLRWDHVALAVLVAALALASDRTLAFCAGAYPIALVALLYGSMRYVAALGVTPERVHDCDLHELERRLFGITHD